MARKTVFVEDPTNASDNPGIKVGRYIETESRFISEYTPEGYCKLTFGSATVTADDQLAQFAKQGYHLGLKIIKTILG